MAPILIPGPKIRDEDVIFLSKVAKARVRGEGEVSTYTFLIGSLTRRDGAIFMAILHLSYSVLSACFDIVTVSNACCESRG